MWSVATTLLLSRIEVTIPGFCQQSGGTRSQGRGCMWPGKGEVGGTEMMGVSWPFLPSFVTSPAQVCPAPGWTVSNLASPSDIAPEEESPNRRKRVTKTRSSAVGEREGFWEFRHTCSRDYRATIEVHVRMPADILLMCCHVEIKSCRVVCRG